jgi:hypothetical protein
MVESACENRYFNDSITETRELPDNLNPCIRTNYKSLLIFMMIFNNN